MPLRIISGAIGIRWGLAINWIDFNFWKLAQLKVSSFASIKIQFTWLLNLVSELLFLSIDACYFSI